jgi:Domain of unknown function (DUF5911)
VNRRAIFPDFPHPTHSTTAIQKSAEKASPGGLKNMPARIENYALVDKNGSIDWLCRPDFSSDACFAALLGTEKNGYWKITPADNCRMPHPCDFPLASAGINRARASG